MNDVNWQLLVQCHIAAMCGPLQLKKHAEEFKTHCFIQYAEQE